jgi:hypothetical protein
MGTADDPMAVVDNQFRVYVMKAFASLTLGCSRTFPDFLS